MARPCPRCQSRSVRHDRSLAGRAVCGHCGLPVGTPWPSGAPLARAPRRSSRLAWLLPLVLAAGGGLLVAQPAWMPGWWPAPGDTGAPGWLERRR